MFFRLINFILVSAVVTAACYTPAVAEGGFRLSPGILDLSQAPGTISIDGNLDDPGWTGAARASGFFEQYPGDQTDPAVRTVARVTYDAENLYLACVCYDDPGDIRATYCERDNLVGNDVVIWMIDTYGQGTWAYSLYTNALGIQTDALWTVLNEDFSYNIIYESAGRITDSGYQVEMAIPFSSLNFPNRDRQQWRFNILRIRPRESWYEYTWSPYDRNNPCWPCQWGMITGIEDISSSQGLELLPGFIGYQYGEAGGSFTSDDPYRFANQDPDGEASLNTKYRPASNISVEVAINPDFSQIEPDAAQIDLNTTSALLYPERRPFFQEASELFYTWRMVYYSRLINDPLYALKASGKIGGTDFGYIFARDEHSPFIKTFRDASAFLVGGQSVSNVLRLRHTFSQDTYGGILITDRRLDQGGSGTVFNFDGQLLLHENWRFQVQTMASLIRETRSDYLNTQIQNYIDRGWVDSTFGGGRYTSFLDGEFYSGHYLIFNIEERSRHLDFDFGYIEISPTYQSDLGATSTNNWRSVTTYGNYTLYFANGWLEKLDPHYAFVSKWDIAGNNRYRELTLGLRSSLHGQLTLNTSFSKMTETYLGIEFKDIWDISGYASKSFSEQVFVRASIDYGQQISRSRLQPGREISSELYAYLRPNDRLLIEPSYKFLQSKHAETGENLYEGYIVRVKSIYFFNRQLNIRLISQYSSIYEILNVDPLLTYRINPFTVFYFGSSYEYCRSLSYEAEYPELNTYLNRRQFFIKLQYLLQI